MRGVIETEQTTSLLQFSLIELVTKGEEPACLSGTLVRRYRDYGPSGAAGRDTLRQSLLVSFTGLLTVSDCPVVKLRNQFATCANRQKRRTQLN